MGKGKKKKFTKEEQKLQYIIALSRYDSGEWFQFPYFLLKVMRDREAIMFSYLSNLCKMSLKKAGIKEYHFRATTPELMKGLHWSKDKVERSLKALKKKGWITVEVRGASRVRWVMLDVAEVFWAQSQHLADEMGIDHTSAAVIHENSIAAQVRGRKAALVRQCTNTTNKNTLSVGSKLSDVYLPLAETLLNGIKQVRSVNYNAKPKQWARSFKLLHTKDGATLGRIQEVLNWYCAFLKKHGDPNTNGNQEYLPIAFSGHSFRAKFMAVERAMSRISPHKRKPKVKIKITSIKYEDLTKSEQEEIDNDPNNYLDDL